MTKEEPYSYQRFGYCRIGGGIVRVSTHELVSCKLRKGPWVRPLVIVLWSLGEKGAHA
jgi:hypothetical protein